ncbi:phage tail length tape measure family protein [Yersinia ruckeri]|uniref:phage tail length tape measure family protein n=1 Tax=Yersinia ruckeri TaxID=29486 RepID=UPI001F3C94A1|nr:phage tail length tape measure family protein [Yersinia ruckeri]UIM99570.1 phage tail length tape measure family protein [Yersinia ruckeri]
MQRNLSHIAAMAFNEPLLLEPAYARVFFCALGKELGAGTLSIPQQSVTLDASGMQLALNSFMEEGKQPARFYQVNKGIAVLPVTGTLVHKLGAMRPFSGMTGYDGIIARLQQAVDDPEVQGILLDIDSPGGQAAGAFDCADLIARLGEQKPIQATAFGQATAAMQRQDLMLKKMNISAGQYKNALGLLPAQMTDVVTQLAGGQNPFLILIQQGGQVKDSFGGIKNTLTALRSIISPVGLAVVATAATVGVLAYAYYKAEQEQQAFNRSLILTGNYAGKTTGELQALARSLSGKGVSQSTLANALAQTAGTGAFTGSAVDMIAHAAAQLEQATGASIDSTIEQFKRLQKDPVAAVKALDDQLHFLTATQLEQILTLASQGREQEAARVATEAYASAINSRTAEIKGNLGSLETAWDAVKNAAGKAWNAMLDVGRETSTGDKLEATRRQLEDAQRNLSNLQKGTVPGFGTNTQAITAQQEQVSQLQKQLGELSEKSYQEAVKAGREKADRDEQERQKRQLTQTEALNKEYESEAARHQRKLEQIRNSGATQEAITNAVRTENERYAKSQSHGKKGIPQGVSLADSYRQRLAQTREAQRLEEEGANKLTQSERDLIALRQRLNDLNGRSLSQSEKSVVANAAVLENLLSQNVAEEKALEHQKALTELKRKGEQLTLQLGQEAQRDERTRALELQGQSLGERARERLQQQAALQDHYAQLRGELERSATQKGTKDSAEYQHDVQMLQASLDERLPVLYGEMQIGGRVISQELSTRDEGSRGRVVVMGR